MRSDVEYCQNIRVIQRSRGERLLLEASQPVRVQRKRLRQNLNRHIPFQTRVAGAVHLAHSSRAEQANDLVRSQLGAGG